MAASHGPSDPSASAKCSQPEIIRWLRDGAALFNEGRYWQAHEDWEQAWRKLADPEKLYVQALIQIAAAFVHFEKGREGPALRLCALALDKLARTASVEGFRIAMPGASESLNRILRDPANWRTEASGLQAFFREPPT